MEWLENSGHLFPLCQEREGPLTDCVLQPFRLGSPPGGSPLALGVCASSLGRCPHRQDRDSIGFKAITPGKLSAWGFSVDRTLDTVSWDWTMARSKSGMLMHTDTPSIRESKTKRFQ